MFFYRDFFNGDFKNSEVVYVLSASILQLFIAVALFSEGFFLSYGILFGIIFLVLLAPLGVGSAFPATLLMAVALIIINAKENEENQRENAKQSNI